MNAAPSTLNWDQVAESAQKEARKLQRALVRVLELWDSPLMTRAELEKRGAEAYEQVFGKRISERHLRRLIQRTLNRAAAIGTGKDWTRPELFLCDHPALVLAHQAADGTPFAELLQTLCSFAAPAQPSAEEEAQLWLQAWRLYKSRTAAGVSGKTAKAELLSFLRQHAPWLSEGEHDALRVMVARQFAKHMRAETNGENIAAAALDGRVAKRGQPTAPAIPKDDIEKIVGYALFNCGGRLAQAERELVELRGESGISEATLDLMDAGADKSYVNARLAKEARPKIDMASPYLLGKKAVDDATPSLRRDYSKLRSMQVVTADDFTLPVYFWLKDGNGNPVLDSKRRPLLTRGQVLIFTDVRSLKILTWVLIPARNYDSLHIRTGMNTVCLEHGRPDFWYFEGGSWKRANIVKGRPPKEWRRAHDSEVEAQYGWEKLGVRFIHATRARSKPAELVGKLLHDRLERCRGFCGREGERYDCPEETKKAKLAVEARREHPSKHFYSFDEWQNELGTLIWKYNADAQQGTILDGRSPDQAFEEFWPHDNPPAKFDASCWHLCAHYVSERPVTSEGITFQIGNQRFTYRDENLARRRYEKVRVYFEPGHPEVVAVTDMAGKNPFFVQRSNPVEFLDALDADGPAGENYRRELAKQSGFNGAAKAVFRSAKITFERTYRKNLVDRQTAALGTELLAKRDEALKQSSEVDRRKARILKLANRLNKPVETLRDFSEETEHALKRTLERRQAALAIEGNETE